MRGGGVWAEYRYAGGGLGSWMNDVSGSEGGDEFGLPGQGLPSHQAAPPPSSVTLVAHGRGSWMNSGCGRRSLRETGTH